MSVERWKAEATIVEKMKELVTLHHPDLIPVVDEIAVIFRERATGANTDNPQLGKSSKAPSILNALGDKQYCFVIELAADEWQSLNSDQRSALLDHQLCFFEAEFDSKTGEYKCRMRKPDFVGFKDEIRRHGMWRPQENEEETLVVSVEDNLGI